jgi:hypothetical protein
MGWGERSREGLGQYQKGKWATFPAFHRLKANGQWAQRGGPEEDIPIKERKRGEKKE